MAIEFSCENCEQLVRTPDNTAGKKGKCPFCGALMQIPDPEGRAKAGERPAPPPPPSPPASAIGPATRIHFSCPSCGKALSAQPELAGKKARCSRCGTVSRIPRTSTAKALPTPSPYSAKASAAAPIEFTCPECSKIVRTPAITAGKKGKCPHCAAVVQIPSQSLILDAADLLEELPEDVSDGVHVDEDLFDELPGLQPIANPLGLGPSGPPTPASNPYSAPASPAPQTRTVRRRSSRETVRTWVIFPAILLIVNAVAALGISIISIIYLAVSFHTTGRAQIQNVPPEQLEQFQSWIYLGLTVAAVIVMAWQITIIAGAAQMIRMENWGFALTSCIMSLMTCNNWCCITGFPLGVIGIIVLSLPDVRRAFD